MVIIVHCSIWDQNWAIFSFYYNGCTTIICAMKMYEGSAYLYNGCTTIICAMRMYEGSAYLFVRSHPGKMLQKIRSIDSFFNRLPVLVVDSWSNILLEKYSPLTYTEKTIFSFPFKLNGIWSSWQSPFRFLTK